MRAELKPMSNRALSFALGGMSRHREHILSMPRIYKGCLEMSGTQICVHAHRLYSRFSSQEWDARTPAIKATGKRH